MTTKAPDISVRSLEAYFIGLNEPINRWGNVVSSFLALPGLVGFWPMSSVARNSADVYDLSGQGRTLTRNGNVQFKTYNNIVPYADFDGSGDYLARADEAGLQISGTETFYENKGLTMGGWFWADGAGATDGLIGKWTESGNQRAYLLLTLSNTFRLAISSDGTASTQLSHSSTFSTGQWYFAVGKYEPSTRMSVFMNGVKAETTTSIPASIFNSSAALQIGAYNAGTQELDGRVALAFLCANALPDAIINGLYEQTKVLYE